VAGVRRGAVLRRQRLRARGGAGRPSTLDVTQGRVALDGYLHRGRAEGSELLDDRAAKVAGHRLTGQDACDAEQVGRRRGALRHQLGDGMSRQLRGEVLHARQRGRQLLAVHDQLIIPSAERHLAVARHRDERAQGSLLLVGVLRLMQHQPDEPREVSGKGD
jgi:hypothetical protein